MNIQVETEDGCPYYNCLSPTPASCPPPPSCPPGTAPRPAPTSAPPLKLQERRPRRYTLTGGAGQQCPVWECSPVFRPASCSYAGSSLSTFDKLELQTELCHQTLVQSETGDWGIECKLVQTELKQKWLKVRLVSSHFLQVQ